LATTFERLLIRLRSEAESATEIHDDATRAVIPNEGDDSSAQVLDAARLRSFTRAPTDPIPSDFQLTAEIVRSIQVLAQIAGEFASVMGDLCRSPAELRKRLYDHDLSGLNVPSWMRERPEYRKLGEGNYFQELPLQREAVRQRYAGLIADFDSTSTQAADFRALLSLPTFVGLVALLGCFLGVGVVLPLFFLSAQGGWSRNLIVWSFVVLAALFWLYLANEVRKLAQAKRVEKPWR
jgi:hypothetical protein